jgi:hypothetical protein
MNVGVCASIGDSSEAEQGVVAGEGALEADEQAALLVRVAVRALDDPALAAEA